MKFLFDQPSRRTLVVLLSVGAALVSLVFAVPAEAQSDESFSRWLESIRVKALEEGIPSSIIDNHLSGLELDTKVLENASNQAEFNTPYSEYRNYFVTPRMIEEGKRLKEKYRPVLRELERRYGVPANILIAIWGIESRYGEKRSRYNAVPSLASMAYTSSSRREYFTGELLTVLRLINRNNIRTENLRSSWAGALGQPQFMPSSYETYAVDFDGDNRRDIWDTPVDVLASIANYLDENGWNRSKGWGHRLSADASVSAASTYSPDGTDETYERTGNFSVLLTYNQSKFYALTVGLLSNEIGDLKEGTSNLR